MGKAENNFENKWLEEREDGFFLYYEKIKFKRYSRNKCRSDIFCKM